MALILFILVAYLCEFIIVIDVYILLSPHKEEALFFVREETSVW